MHPDRDKLNGSTKIKFVSTHIWSPYQPQPGYNAKASQH